MKTKLSVADRHMLKIARQTMRLTDLGVTVMGGQTKDEARAVILRLTGRKPRNL